MANRDHLKLVRTQDRNGNSVHRWKKDDEDRQVDLPDGVEASVSLPDTSVRSGDQEVVDNERMFLMPEIDGKEVSAVQCFSLNDSMKTKLSTRGKGYPETFYEIEGQDGAEAYHDRLAEVAESSKFGAAVDVPSVDDLDSDDHRMFMSEDGTCGFVLKRDEESTDDEHDLIVGVFAGPGSPPKSADSMLVSAVAQGGKRLDCYDTILPKLYSGVGFRETERWEWDDQYKPDDWDYETFSQYNGGRPDVVFMSFDKSASPYFDEKAAKTG